MTSSRFARGAAALALVASGTVVGRLVAPASVSAAADQPPPRGALLEVVSSPKTNEPIAFLYDADTRRLIVYTTVAGGELRILAVRDTEYDARIVEYHNQNEKGMSVAELKKRFADEKP